MIKSKSHKLPLIYRKRSTVSRVTDRAPPRTSMESARFSAKVPKLFERNESNKRGSMDHYAGSVGVSAKLGFMETYKSRSRLSERNRLEKIEDTPDLAFLEAVDRNQLNPKPFGIVRRSGKESEIDIRMFSMGDNYAKAFSEGLKHHNSLQNLNIKSNRLSDIGAQKILSNLNPSQIRFINIAENKLGQKSVNKLVQIIAVKESSLRHLDLEHTNLGGLACIDLCKNITENNTIVFLNLARNNIGNFAEEALGEMIKYNRSLVKLDLHYNNICGRTALCFYEGLAQNDKLEELDLSWNAQGRSFSEEIPKALSEALRLNSVLKHLDLSYNFFTLKECELISVGLDENHDLLGLHMIGNKCEVDARGFVKPCVNYENVEKGHLYKRILKPHKGTKKSSQLINCWVCEDWVEVVFKWVPGESGPEDSEPLCLHLECDSYQPELMQKQPSGVFELTRMVPPGDLKFFFTCNTEPIKSNTYKSKTLKIPLKKQLDFWGKSEVLSILSVNSLKVPESQGSYETKPRIPGLKYEIAEEELERIEWSIGISLFKDYKFDNDKLTQECFEFDWSYSKLTNLVKDPADQEAVKQLLSEYYYFIKAAFKNLSSMSGFEIPSIGKNVLSEFLNACNVLDQSYSQSDLGVNWNSTILQKEKGQKYNPGGTLVRHEFLEILTRIANDRYVRKGLSEKIAEAVEKLFEEHLINFMKKLDQNIWRMGTYVCEEVDVVLKANKLILDNVFKSYSGKKALPGQKHFVSLEEFRELCNDIGLVKENFGQREIDQCYFQAMMTQKDELYQKRHTEMNFVEFLEALSRAIDTSNPEKFAGMDLGQLSSVLPVEEDSLAKKLENSMPRLLKVCSEEVQDKFNFPTSQTYKKLLYKTK